MRFKIDWASLIVRSKFSVFTLFYSVRLYLSAIFQVQAPGGAYIWRGDLTEGFLRYRRGLFSEFYSNTDTAKETRVDFFSRVT